MTVLHPPCPICGKPSVEKLLPFCSERCKMVDLNNWMSGQYRIPTDERPDEEGWDPEGNRRSEDA